MRMTKKVTSIVLAVLMVVSMMVVGAVSVNAATLTASTQAEFTTAYSNAVDGDTIQITGDFTLSSAFDNQKDITINFGTNTISFTTWKFENHGTLTLNGTTGGISCQKGCVDNYGTLTVNGGVYTTSERYSGTAIYTNPGATTTIEGCTVNASRIALYNEGGSLTINGGSINSDASSKYPKNTSGQTAYAYAVILSGGTTVINGGTITGVHGGISAENGAKVVINDANVTTANSEAGKSDAYYALYVSGNGTTVTVKDGTYESPRSAVMLDDNDIGNTEDTTLTIEDGTFTSPNGVNAVSRGDNDSLPVVSGGTYSSNIPVEYLDNTVDVQPNQSGGYDVVDSGKTYVARVGSDRYETLSAAIEAAQNGDTVKLLNDVTETVTISGKELTLDLYGFNITSASKKMPITAIDGTKLTIVNSNTAKAENTPTQNAIMGPSGSNNQGSLNAKGEGTTVDIKAGYYYGYNGNKTAINAINGATVTFWGGTVNGAEGIDDTTAGKEGKVFYSGVSNPQYPNATTPGYIVVRGGTFSGRMSDSNWGNYTIDGGTFDRNEVVLNENPVDANGNRVATANKSMDQLPNSPGTLEEAGWLANGFAVVDNGDGTYGVVVDNSSPLNPIEKVAADINDGNKFGLTCDYLKGTLLGVQKKEAMENEIEGSSTTSESHQEGEKNIRFVAVLDTDLVQGADDYGFVLAKVSADKTYSDKIENIKYGMESAKTISAKDTYNNVCGNEAYGDPSNLNTPYKYITCAVNNIDDTSKIVARFYYKKGDKVYYAKYAGHNYQYTGCISTANATS